MGLEEAITNTLVEYRRSGCVSRSTRRAMCDEVPKASAREAQRCLAAISMVVLSGSGESAIKQATGLRPSRWLDVVDAEAFQAVVCEVGNFIELLERRSSQTPTQMQEASSREKERCLRYAMRHRAAEAHREAQRAKKVEVDAKASDWLQRVRPWFADLAQGCGLPEHLQFFRNNAWAQLLGMEEQRLRQVDCIVWQGIQTHSLHAGIELAILRRMELLHDAGVLHKRHVVRVKDAILSRELDCAPLCEVRISRDVFQPVPMTEMARQEYRQAARTAQDRAAYAAVGGWFALLEQEVGCDAHLAAYVARPWMQTLGAFHHRGRVPDWKNVRCDADMCDTTCRALCHVSEQCAVCDDRTLARLRQEHASVTRARGPALPCGYAIPSGAAAEQYRHRHEYESNVRAWESLAPWVKLCSKKMAGELNQSLYNTAIWSRVLLDTASESAPRRLPRSMGVKVARCVLHGCHCGDDALTAWARRKLENAVACGDHSAVWVDSEDVAHCIPVDPDVRERVAAQSSNPKPGAGLTRTVQSQLMAWIRRV